jgi:sugar phosphate isomerase/epimerase
MRFGGPISDWGHSPEDYIQAARREGYRAVYCPYGADCDDDTAAALARAAAAADVVIAEVGAWSNPISSDDSRRAEALEKCIGALALAEKVGARCTVNITGSRGEKWDGPDPRDLTDETFDMIVESVRRIVDAVRPARTFYTLETMPWMYPDSAESYARLLAAIDRPAVAVHFDPVNLINCPARYFHTGEVIRDFLARLGPKVRSCHAKDIILDKRLTVRLTECVPGTGALDYRTFLSELSRLDPDVTLMMEHMQREQYPVAARHIRSVAAEAGVTL